MRRFRDIVEDIKAPSPRSLWLDKGKLKFFGTKGWTLVAGEEGPDLSGYAKLSGAVFTGRVETKEVFYPSQLHVGEIHQTEGNRYLLCHEKSKRSSHNTYSTDGQIADIGSEESFVFTLEDDSKVTKSIRVISTTNS